eukprot:4481875-Ditylum_brightwellii.AAC.1
MRSVSMPSLPPIRICPLYASQPRLCILLPEYDPKLLTPIKARADWNETHPKTNIGVVMKNNRTYEYDFAQDTSRKIDFEEGSYLRKPPTQTIP